MLNKIKNFLSRIRLPSNLKLPKIGRPSAFQLIFWTVSIAVAVVVFIFARSLTACWRITDLPGSPPAGCKSGSVNPLGTPMINEQGTPIAAVDLPPTPVPIELLPPAWDGASRINILFIGLDYRDWITNEGPPRSDTMILFTVDPLTKSAGMLSIPRDMWVNIPGVGYSRINTAYSSGEANQFPGGGPGLAMKTVENFIGVPVHYYAQVDFGTFTDFIDYIGGIDVNVEQDLVLDLVGPGYDPLGVLQRNDPVVLIGRNANASWVQIEFPTSPDGAGWIKANSVRADGLDGLPIVAGHEKATPTAVQVARIDTTIGVDTEDIRPSPKNPNMVMVKCCGLVHMDGNRALAFARTRKTEGGDVDRAHRQQSVIEAIQRKVFNVEIFPSLIQNAPALFERFQTGIHTNMPLEDAIRLAVLGKDISLASVKKGVIDYSMVTFDNVTLDGQAASIFRPIPDKIRVLRDDVFTTSGAVGPIAGGDPVALMQAEEARVRVLAPDYARASQYFASLGMNVTETGSGGGGNQTAIIVYGPKVYTLRYLTSAFGFSYGNIRFSPDPAQSVDLEIQVGYDLAIP